MEKDFEGLVIGNQGENFSVGANIMLVVARSAGRQLGRAQRRDKGVSKHGHVAALFAPRPVVAAPFQLALGGGCEVMLGADAIHSAAEVYTGLVEVGVGLIPAGGGTKEIYARILSRDAARRRSVSVFAQAPSKPWRWRKSPARPSTQNGSAILRNQIPSA